MKIDVECSCGRKNSITKGSYTRATKKHGKYMCLSCVMRKPDISKRNSDIQKLRFSKKENRKKMSESLKEYFSEDEIIRKKSKIAKKLWSKDDYRERVTRATKKLWSKDDYRERVIVGITDSWTEERKKQQGKISQDLWNDPLYQSTQHAARVRMWEDEEYKNKQTKASKKLWQTSDYRLKQAAALSKAAKKSILDDIVLSICKKINSDARPISLGPWTFDCYIHHNNKHLLIEANGDFWHNTDERKIRDKQKATYYKNYLSDRYTLLTIWEHEFYCTGKIIDKINGALGITQAVIEYSLQDVEIELIKKEESAYFYSCYHYLRKPRAGIHYGVKLNKELIACITFSCITRNETAKKQDLDPSEILELSRMAVKPSHRKKNLCSFVISRCIKSIKTSYQGIQTIVTFADTTVGHTGSVYKATGFTEDGIVKPTYWYIDNLGYYRHKKTVWDQAKRLNKSESEYADYCGLIKIKGKHLIRFVKRI